MIILFTQKQVKIKLSLCSRGKDSTRNCGSIISQKNAGMEVFENASMYVTAFARCRLCHHKDFKLFKSKNVVKRL